MGLSPENKALVERLEQRFAISPQMADELHMRWGQANALLDAARKEAATRRDADIDALANQLVDCQSALQASDAKVTALVEALEPFAYEFATDCKDTELVLIAEAETGDYCCTVADFRRVADCLRRLRSGANPSDPGGGE